MRLEETGPDETWVRENMNSCVGTQTDGILEGTLTCPVGAKHYRLTEEAHGVDVTAFAHLTD